MTSNLALDGKIPLLDITGSKHPLGCIDALAEPCIGVQRNSRHGRAIAQREGRIDVVLCLLGYSLDEWKLRRRERCGDSRLIKEHDAESAAHHCLRSQ